MEDMWGSYGFQEERRREEGEGEGAVVANRL